MPSLDAGEAFAQSAVTNTIIDLLLQVRAKGPLESRRYANSRSHQRVRSHTVLDPLAHSIECARRIRSVAAEAVIHARSQEETEKVIRMRILCQD